jgi:cell division septum initiation protein DivIVA
MPGLSAGRKLPRAAEKRPTWLGTRSADAVATAVAQNGVSASPLSTPARERARLPRADSRGSYPSALSSNADLGLARFTALTALHCARLDLLVGDLATAEEELTRAYEAVTSREETHLLPPISEPPAQPLRAGGDSNEAGEIPRAAEAPPASDAVEPKPLWPSPRRSGLGWREQADEAEWRAREALDLVRLGTALARLSSWHPRSPSGEGERRASERCPRPARRSVVPAPRLAREGVLREILANENLPDGYARELALETLDIPEELWCAKTTIDPSSDLIGWRNRFSCTHRPAASGRSRELGIGSGRGRIGHTRPVADDEAPHEGEEESKLAPSPEESSGLAYVQARVPEAIRQVSFPSAARGYERRAVDSYVNQVNRLIAELELGRSPQAAVRHALEQVGEQTKGLLHQARETAEKIAATAREEAEGEVGRAKTEAEEILAGAHTAEAGAEEIVAKAKADADDTLAGARTEAADITARAHAEAEEVLARSRAEAAERLQRLEEEIAATREQAEARMQELHAETEAVWKERHELLDEIHVMGTRLLEVASTAAARVSPTETSDEATAEAASAPEDESAQA